jgi:probable phosphoglycerate mutase
MADVGPAILLLVRHAHTDAIGLRLSGRTAEALSAAGRVQADLLARMLAGTRVAAIYTSPLQRTLETARALARHQAAPVREDAGLIEVDFGDWTGRTFEELDALPEWHAFNRSRGTAVIPGGETARDVQQRIVSTLERLRRAHAGSTLAVVTHGDVVRYAVLHYARAPLDLYGRFEISPASVTGLRLASDPCLLYVNRTFSSWA